MIASLDGHSKNFATVERVDTLASVPVNGNTTA